MEGVKGGAVIPGPSHVDFVSIGGSRWTLEELVDEPDCVRSLILDEQVESALLATGDSEVLYALAGGDNLSSMAQEELLDLVDDHLGLEVPLAMNPGTSPRILVGLVERYGRFTVGDVALNRSATPEVFAALLRCGDTYGLYSLATRRDLPRDFQVLLAEGQRPLVYSGLAANPFVHPDAQVMLLRLQLPDVTAVLVSNPALVLDVRMPARFVFDAFEGRLREGLEAAGVVVDQEAFQVLGRAWSGDVASLVEACHLVER